MNDLIPETFDLYGCISLWMQSIRDPDVEAVAEQMGSLTVTTEVFVSASSEQTNPERMDLDKRIRALKKKVHTFVEVTFIVIL